MDAREWALAYAAIGWRVFPVLSGGKRPLYQGWQRDATTESGLIERHWSKEPAPNMGTIVDVTDAEWDQVADLFDPECRRGAAEMYPRRLGYLFARLRVEPA